jgi:hypothetical protein
MKFFFLFITFLVFNINAIGQQATVEKNIYGFQIGLLSASFQYETKLARKIALHFETGASLYFYETASFNSNGTRKLGTITAPFFSVEPRFYYGLDRRLRLNKNIRRNGSNFISINTTYAANNNEITNSHNDYEIVPSIFIIPTYGIRRNFAKNFNYEFLFGLGYRYNIFSKTKGCNCAQSETDLNLQAKIGYNF